MEPKISRKKSRTVSGLMGIAVVLCLICVIISDRSGKMCYMLISLGFSLYTAYRMDQVHKCPHCGARFKGIDDTAPNAGYCRKCGKLMEFDEECTE